MFGNCFDGWTRIAHTAQKKHQYNLSENVEKRWKNWMDPKKEIVLCLEGYECSEGSHNTHHILPCFLVEQVTRCGGTDCYGDGKLTITLKGDSIEEIREKDCKLQTQISASLEELVRGGEPKDNLGGSLYIRYKIRSSTDKIYPSEPRIDERELRCTGIYKLFDGGLIVKYEGDPTHMRDVDPEFDPDKLNESIIKDSQELQ